MIIVTGFGPFKDIESNPSAKVATKVAIALSKIGKQKVFNATIAVSDEGISNFYLEANLQLLQASFIVHIGVHAAATTLSIELVAFNKKADSEDEINNGLELLPSTCPLHDQALHKWMIENRDSVAWSRDAGTYYCNELYFKTLSMFRDNSSGTQTKNIIFIHVPLESVVSVETCSKLIIEFMAIIDKSLLE